MSGGEEGLGGRGGGWGGDGGQVDHDACIRHPRDITLPGVVIREGVEV
jgi:hypothetical protein